jgi:hypothetical protein
LGGEKHACLTLPFPIFNRQYWRSGGKPFMQELSLYFNQIDDLQGRIEALRRYL